ncbi:MAG: DUF2281 domain-containing protein [Symploca sp. SIO1B1]|nr:DUF2281 domain-containing protein [Symploca sp. SIO1B1]
MIQSAIIEKLESLPESLQLKVLDYVDSLIKEREQSANAENIPKKYRFAGSMKGTFVLPLPEDFDAPLDDFEEYI